MNAMTSFDFESEYQKKKFNELSLTSNIKKMIGLIERDIYIRAGDISLAVKLLTISMTGAMVSVSIPENNPDLLTPSGHVDIHFSFMGVKPYLIPTAFLMGYSIFDIADLPGVQGLNRQILKLTAFGVPEFYLVKVLSDIIDMQSFSTRRREERVAVNGNTSEQLGLKSVHCVLYKGDTRKESSLHDLSLSGCRILTDRPALQRNDHILIDIFIREPDAVLEIPGRIMRISEVESGAGEFLAGIKFNEGSVPDEYFSRMHTLLG